MRAVTRQRVENVSVEDLADPIIREPTDAIVEIPSTAVCRSDLHLDRRQIAVGDQP
jgi:threonine dehydrogenase-like Zn-dependent dehydrogenase